MKVLIVCSATQNRISPFILDQVESLKLLGVNFDFFTIKQKGLKGYINHLSSYYKKIRSYKPDIVHAHYGLSGLFANLQRRYPVVTTYHGSDINENLPFVFSKISILLSKQNIFVSTKLAKRAKQEKAPIISCGVDLSVFQPMDKNAARRQLGLEPNRKYILFSSYFANPVKNYPLAKAAITEVKARGIEIELVEYKGYSREQAAVLFNAVDCILVTSHKESGPLVIKEAMAVNTHAVSVDVGDVKWLFEEMEGYIIANANPTDISDGISQVITHNTGTFGRKRIETLQLDSDSVAKKILTIYTKIITKTHKS